MGPGMGPGMPGMPGIAQVVPPTMLPAGAATGLLPAAAGIPPPGPGIPPPGPGIPSAAIAAAAGVPAPPAPGEVPGPPGTPAPREQGKGGKGKRGGGGGGGSGGGGGGKGWSSVPANFDVDPEKRFKGTVEFYSKLKGYGFIEVAEKGVVPEDRIFVQWRNIQSEDRFPFLVKGLDVEFGVMKWRDPSQRGQVSLRARAVTTSGGGSVHLQDEIDAAKKTFIGTRELRYTGNLKFYNPKAGYGYITVDPEFITEGSTVPSELRVERSEVNAAGKQPQWMQNLAVEFGIWITSRGVPKAYNVTLPGGVALTQAALENRQAVGGQTYRGEVQMWNWRQGWGFVKPDPSVALPPHVQAKLTQQTEAARQKAEEKGKPGSNEELLYVRRADVAPGVKLSKDMQVMFQLYVDDKGVGIMDVHTI